jgi:ABC-2 type transport system ATP-binding protein
MIRARGLRKVFGYRVKALDGLDLTVPAGAIYGFIGQNGAGKTTAIRTIATLLTPDAGEAVVCDLNVVQQAREVRRVVGYMPDFFGVYDDLKVDEYLDFYAILHGLSGSSIARLRDDLLELVDLTSKRNDYVEALSRGMQQRLCLARALIHDPQVLLLDEPASGLDPIARVEMRGLLRELGRMGKTILISSHILSELTDLCTHVGIIAGGRMLREGPLDEVLWALERPGYFVRVLEDPERAAEVLEMVAGVGAVEIDPDGSTVHFRCEGGAEGAAAALAATVEAKIKVARFGEMETSLETTFVRLARGEAAVPGEAVVPGEEAPRC